MTNEPKSADRATTQITEQPASPAPPPAADAPANAAAAMAPSVSPSSAAWIVRTDFALLALVLTISFFVASFAATNSDLWFNLAVGKRISEGKYEFGVDPYSWATEAFDGTPAVYWVNHSWLYSWLLFHAYQLVGGVGLVIGKAVFFTAAIVLLSRIGWSNGNRWFIVICLVMAALAVSGRLLVQSMVLSYFFLALTLYVLHRAGAFALKNNEAPPADPRWLWSLPPLFVLWVNLDSWFVLGLALIGLCWAATGMARWFRETGLAPGKTLGLVFGASALACLVNPHHVRAFQLPPELAYVALSLTEPLRLPLPDEIVAGGRTLKEMQKAELNVPWAASPFSPNYWNDRRLGWNIAAWAVPPLLLLGFMGFGLMAFIRPQQNAPSLQAGRFLIWLVFTVLALALFRFIPFFALVAAPLTAMTLGEFLSWQQTAGAVALANRERGLNLARFVSVPFFLLLLYLAWPGWLHGTTEYNAPRRVCWEVRPDPSLVQSAQALDALQKAGECGNVFNATFDMGNYLPWFAPGVKYFMDTRFYLYPHLASQYGKARLALDEQLPAATWRDFFGARRIKQVVMAELLAQGRFAKWWFDPDHWRQHYGDTKASVFSWSGPEGRWPTHTARDDWNRQAFGDVDPWKRPPSAGASWAPAPTFLTLYLDGTGAEPAGATESLTDMFYYDQMGRVMQPLTGLMSPQVPNQPPVPPSLSFVLFYGSLGNLQAIPGGGMGAAPAAAGLLYNWTLIRARDLGPPAIPVLAVRAARRAVAANPLDVASHGALMNANEMVRKAQEDYWINFLRLPGGSPHPAVLRDRLRQYQLLGSAVQLAQLQPDALEHHLRVAQLYEQQNLRDLALDHLNLARKQFEIRLASGQNASKSQKEKDQVRKQFDEHIGIEHKEKSVRQRRKQLKEKGDKLSPLKKARYALVEPFQEFVGGKIQESPLGLGKEALDLIAAIDAEKLEGKDHEPYISLRFDLLLMMGRADVVAENLKEESVRKILQPFFFASYQLMAGGVLGNYDAMEEGLATIEETLRAGVKETREEATRRGHQCIGPMIAAGTQRFPSAFLVTLTTQTAPAIVELDHMLFQSNNLKSDLCNAITLRGIVALEAGDTAKARTHFQKALDEAGVEFGFSEFLIARRYLDLLNEQKR